MLTSARRRGREGGADTARGESAIQIELGGTSPIDFYQEVRLFEIELIKWALRLTGGYQRGAAHLLNLRPTTLGHKIKFYNIDPKGFHVYREIPGGVRDPSKGARPGTGRSG